MSTISKGDRVRFIGINAEAAERKDQDITGEEGMWPLLSVGAVGTVTEVIPDDESGSGRLFAAFDECPCPGAELAALFGMPEGWPVLDSEVEALVTNEAV